MNRFIDNYTNKNYDVIVVGGGITGASVAYEAALRGFTVALIEKNDFACATSSATSKMIHGGLRYLAKGEIHLVRESLKERRILMNIAPNLVHPLPFIYAMYNTDKVPPIFIRIGMILYQILSFDKKLVNDKSKKMPDYKTLSAKKVKELVPCAETNGLKGAHLYYDAKNHSPERLTLAFVKSAYNNGADVANYVEVTDFLTEKKDKKTQVNGVVVYDKINNKKVEINSKIVINCAGPWADILLKKVLNQKNGDKLVRSEGIHIVINRKYHQNYVFAACSKDNQHYFIIPYRNKTLIGTTDKLFEGNPDNYKVTKQSIEELLCKVNESFCKQNPIQYNEIKYFYGGLRPLVEQDSSNVYKASRKYEVTDMKKNGVEGLIVVEGGKFTTSRSLAKNVVNKIFCKLNIDDNKSNSKKIFLKGCEITNFSQFVKVKQQKYNQLKPQWIEYLCKSYGTEIDLLMEIFYSSENYQKIFNDDGENIAQVVFAIKNEMAINLADILLRRTTIAQLGDVCLEDIKQIAEIASNELNWTEEYKQKQILEYLELTKLPKKE